MTQANAHATMNIDAVYAYLKSFQDNAIDCLAEALYVSFERNEQVDKAVIKAIFDLCLPDIPNAFREMECQVVTTLA